MNWKIWSATDARRFMHAPKADDDKYTRGVLGVIAGSREYPGAAILVTRAALHTGVGMVRFSGPRSLKKLVLLSSPEVVTQKGKVQAWVVGPGIDPDNVGRTRKHEISDAISQGLPTILDAGGLPLIPLIPRSDSRILITPHFRELSRTLEKVAISVTPADIAKDPKKWAVIACQKLNVTVLLKGNVTVIASEGEGIELPPSSSWLATAGSGDVLAGIIGALIATHSDSYADRKNNLAYLAATGALIHARAGERASAGGPISASDVISAIPHVVSELIG